MGAGLIHDFIRNILLVLFCPYHFVLAILSNTILSVYHFVHTILSVPFCPLPFCPRTPPHLISCHGKANEHAFIGRMLSRLSCWPPKSLRSQKVCLGRKRLCITVL